MYRRGGGGGAAADAEQQSSSTCMHIPTARVSPLAPSFLLIDDVCDDAVLASVAGVVAWLSCCECCFAACAALAWCLLLAVACCMCRNTLQ